MTVDELIVNLENCKHQFGGSTEIFVKDQDTGYHLETLGIRPSNNEPDRLLVISQDYDDYFQGNH